jgi:tetratricopeptide (TPR) repeat protein
MLAAIPVLLSVLAFPAQDAATRRLLKEADQAYQERAQPGRAENSLELYKKVLAIDSSSEEAYWKMARSYHWLATHEKDAEKVAKLHKEGAEFSKLAIEANPESVPGHFWLGIHYALYGQARGIGQSLSLVDPIIKEMEWVLKKDESYMEGGAHRALGQVYFKLPGIWGGDNEKALDHFKRSIELAPKNPIGHNFLAEFYLAQGKKAEAIEEFRRALADPGPSEYAPEFREEQEKARARLKEVAP